MKKWLMGILTLITLALIFPLSAYAVTREMSVYTHRDYPDCVFFISWQNTEQQASVRIKSSDENMIEATTQNAEFGKGKVTVRVGDANSGYWTVYVEGDNLGAISVSGGSDNTASTQYNAIQSFTADVSGGYVNFKWNVVAEQDAVNVTISASQGGSSGNRNVFTDYSASKSGTASVSADDLQTGLYNFSIQAYDGKAQYTLNIDEPLYIKQSDALEKLEGVKVGSIDGEMFITWNALINIGYFVTLYDYESLAVIKTEHINTNFYPVALTDGINKVKVSVAAVDGNAYGDFDIFELLRSTPTGTVTFPDYAATKENAMSIYIDCPPDITAGVYLNGTLLLENAGMGSYDLHLSEGDHEIVAYVKDINGNMRTFTKSISVDRTPPIINLTNADEIKTPSDRIVIEGNTEPNATVAINGVEQELGTGNFMARLVLKNGVNPVSVSAYDVAGNKSIKTITAERTGSLDFGWTIFILPGLAFISLMLWYVYLNKKAKGAEAQ